MARFIDTHCHIHAAGRQAKDHTAIKWQAGGEFDPDTLAEKAITEKVAAMICVGTDRIDSQKAVDFAQSRRQLWAAVGIHPHEAKSSTADDLSRIRELLTENSSRPLEKRKIVAVGEVGLDYYYEHSPRKKQAALLENFLQMAGDFKLPVIFHVRQAFADFWPIYNNFKNIRGVLHSFSDTQAEMERAVSNGLYIGINGIVTFTKNDAQLEAAKRIPLRNLLLETDSPYLAPQPLRGKICRPEYVVHTAEFLAAIRGENIDDLADATTANACKLFNIEKFV